MTSDPNQINSQFILPSSPYGISNQRFANVDDPLMPLPQRSVMLAANRLNDYRYKKLSEKQRVFIDIYLSSGFNATEAAKRCGYCNDVPQDERYEKACGAIGRRLMKSQAIALGIHLALEYHAERSRINTDDLITELRHVAFSNMGDYYVNDGTGDPRLQMPEDHERGKLAALSEITVESYSEGRGDNKREVKRIKFKAHDKLGAIDKLLKIAAAKGDPAVAGLSDQQNGNGAPTVNVFNIMPVPSGEFIPAPQPAIVAPVPQYALPAPSMPTATPSDDPKSLPVHVTPPAVTQDPLHWSQPDKAQKRSLTIDHES